jgi:hypothetical protein
MRDRARDPLSAVTRFVAVLGAVLAILLALLTATGARAEPSIAPLVIFAHVSDPTDGGLSDHTTDFLGAGVEIRFGRSFSAEIAAGRKAINCNARGRCRSTPGGYAAIKWTPQIKRRSQP